MLRERTTEQAEPPEQLPASSHPSRLVIAYSPDPAARHRTIALKRDGGILAVGRDVDPTHAAIADTRISRLHFRIVWDGRLQRFRIGDASSTNKLYVNGQPQTSAVLTGSEVIRAGDTLFVFEETDPLAEVNAIAERAAPSNLGLLILGETGVGKGRLARQVHEQSGRKGDFIAVNCATIPEPLAAAELFGHTRSAFSGAELVRQGLFAAAHGGTLFLDEIGDLPLSLQPLLLRALEEGVVRPVGADREQRVDVRIVAATNHDLERRCGDGKFREDLFARLAGLVIRMPALRARRAEILELVSMFSARALTLSADAAEALLVWSWPHNIRELRALVSAFEVASSGPHLELAYLSRRHPKLAEPLRGRQDHAEPRPVATRTGLPEREALKGLLAEKEGNITKVAQHLGKTRAQIYRWMKALGLSQRPFAPPRESQLRSRG